MGAASSGEAVRNAVGETPHNGGIGQLRRGSGGSPKKGSYSVRGGGGDFDDLKKEKDYKDGEEDLITIDITPSLITIDRHLTS